MSTHPTRRIIVALGSNLGDREAVIERAVAAIGQTVGRSALIETAAWIHPDDDADWHPPFLNGVIVALSDEAPLAVLDRLLAIERSLGRERNPGDKPWQPRTIDLDLIAADQEVTDHPRLTLPHPRMHERDFVLRPLVEIWPDWRHPLLGRTAAELLEALERGDGG